MIVLRLQPPVPVNFRVSTKDTSLPVGGGADGRSPIYIRKGTMVSYNVFAMHRRTDLWGKDAKTFRPERWEENAKHGWEYLPFNGGPRICLGRKSPRSWDANMRFGEDASLTNFRTICAHRG
jgi:cytochrome P450